MTRVTIFGPVTGTHGGSGVGGVSTHTAELAAALPAFGVNVTVAADNVRETAVAGTSFGAVTGVQGAFGRREALRTALATLPDSLAALVRARADADRTAHDIPLARAWSRASLLRVACERARAQVLHIQQPDFRPLYARWSGVRVPTLLAVHGLGVAAAEPDGPVARLVAANLAAADLTTAPSRFLADAAIALGADAERMHVVPNAVDHDLFSPLDRDACREALGLDRTRRLVVFLGRAIPMKGAPELVEAFDTLRSRVPGAQLALVGSLGIERPADAAEHAVDASAPIVLRDGAPREELPLWLGAADVVAVPSRYEGFGLVALEALACARPLVLTEVGGLTEVVPAETARFVPAERPDVLADALAWTLEHPAEAAIMAAAGPRTARAYSWRETARGYAALYSELAEGSARRASDS
ncbi:MAG: hypothetical protein Kow0067_02790 [Coriobacteriia bacterium]